MGFILTFSLVISLGLVSLASCIIAELNKTKKKDIKIDGNLCYLPGSITFGFGIAALACLLLAQIMGNLVICTNLRVPTIAKTLMALSWLSSGIAIILISGGTSMNREQGYGKGWLGGQCYIVKDGIFTGSAMLVLLTIAGTLGSAIATTFRQKPEDTCTASCMK